MNNLGIASDHWGWESKAQITEQLQAAGYEVIDFGAHKKNDEDDYPDFIIPLAKAVAAGQVRRGIAICGSGVGASIVANKIAGIRAALINDSFSARQGVEDDNMNIICFGSRVVGPALMWELVQVFLHSDFSGAERHERRLAKIQNLEKQEN